MLEYYPGFVEAAIEYKIHSRKMIAESKSKIIYYLKFVFYINFKISHTSQILHMKLLFTQKIFSTYKKILKQVTFTAASTVKQVRKKISFNKRFL